MHAQRSRDAPGATVSRMTPEPLIHVVREAAGEPEGALVLLHGRGADEHDLVSLLDELDPERRLVGFTPGAPLPGPGGGRWWYMVPRVGHPDPATFHATYAQLAASSTAGSRSAGSRGSARCSAASRWAASCPTRPASARPPLACRDPRDERLHPHGRALAGRARRATQDCRSSSPTAPATPSSRSSSRARRGYCSRAPASTSTTTSTRAATTSTRARWR